MASTIAAIQNPTCPTCGAALDKPLVAVFADMVFDPLSGIATRAGKTIDLSLRERQLLHFLMMHPGQPKTRTEIIHRAWGFRQEEVFTNEVDLYICYLRKKIDGGFETKLIHTSRGIGYFFGTEVA
jgi:DNA-binding response OmpR family regulator